MGTIVTKKIFKFLLYKQYTKFTRISCIASNKTCINIYCKIKPISRTDSLLNFGCGEVIRSLNSLKVCWLKVSLHFYVISISTDFCFRTSKNYGEWKFPENYKRQRCRPLQFDGKREKVSYVRRLPRLLQQHVSRLGQTLSLHGEIKLFVYLNWIKWFNF